MKFLLIMLKIGDKIYYWIKNRDSVEVYTIKEIQFNNNNSKISILSKYGEMFLIYIREDEIWNGVYDNHLEFLVTNKKENILKYRRPWKNL